MGFAALESRNHAASKSAGTSLILPIAGANLAAGNFIIVSVAIDNTATGSGVNSSQVTDVACTGITFSKIGEITNGRGASDGGAACAMWVGLVAETVTTGTNITITHVSKTARAACYQGFSKTKAFVWPDGGVWKPFNVSNADPASQTLAGLSAREHLFVYSIAAEMDNTWVFNTFTNYTAFNNTSGEAGTSGGTGNTNQTIRSVYRIADAAGDTLDVAASGITDGAGIYVGLIESDNPAPAAIRNVVAYASNSATAATTGINANASQNCASFTPQAGNLLVAVVGCNTNTPSDVTVTLTSSPSLTWTKRVEYDTGGGSANNGHVSIWTATASSATGHVVTATRSEALASNGLITIKCFAVGGQYASDPVITASRGSFTGNQANASITTKSESALIIVGVSDLAASGALASSNLYSVDTSTMTGVASMHAGYGFTAEPGAYTFDLNAAGTSNTTTNWVAIEIASYAPPATFTASEATTTGPVSVAASGTFAAATACTATLAATTGGASITAAASLTLTTGLSSRRTTTASGIGGASVGIDPTPDNTLLIFVIAQSAGYTGDAPTIDVFTDNELGLTPVESSGGGPSFINVYMAEATGTDTINVTTDQADCEVTIIAREFADYGETIEVASAATFGMGGNPNLTTYTTALTPDADGELLVAAVVYPQGTPTSLGAGAEWTEFASYSPHTALIGIEEIKVPTVGYRYTAGFTTTDAGSAAWYGVWFRLSSPRPITASAPVTTGPANFSGSASFALTFSGSMVHTLAGSTITAAGFSTAPQYTASSAIILGGASAPAAGVTFRPVFSAVSAQSSAAAFLLASATSIRPVFTASASHQTGLISAAASGVTVPPVFSATSAGSSGPAILVASSIITRPEFTASASRQTGHTSAAASGTTVRPAFTATMHRTVGAGTSAASGMVLAPTYTASAARTSGHVGFAGAGNIVAPVFTASLSRTIRGISTSASGVFAAQVFASSAAGLIGPARLTATGMAIPPVFVAVYAPILAGVRGSACATFDAGIFGCEASLTFSAALVAGSGNTTPPLFGAMLNLPISPVQFYALASRQPPPLFNPAWVSPSKVLVSHA